MTDQDTTTPVPETENSATVAAGAPVGTPRRKVSFIGREKPAPRGRKSGAPRREASEFDQRIIDIRRVTRVVAGGRRFNFSVAVVVGDRNGKVAVGLGKGGDTALAIDKAVRHAKKNFLRVTLTKTKSLRREVEAKYASARVFIKPAPGRGLVAGSSVRAVLDLAGITDVNAKILSRSKNKLNNARAAIKALSMIS